MSSIYIKDVNQGRLNIPLNQICGYQTVEGNTKVYLKGGEVLNTTQNMGKIKQYVDSINKLGI